VDVPTLPSAHRQSKRVKFDEATRQRDRARPRLSTPRDAETHLAEARPTLGETVDAGASLERVDEAQLEVFVRRVCFRV
jgi:hypothetical protein